MKFIFLDQFFGSENILKYQQFFSRISEEFMGDFYKFGESVYFQQNLAKF